MATLQLDKMMSILSTQDLFISVSFLAVVCYLTPISRVAQVLARHLASACGALWKALLSGNTPLQQYGDWGRDRVDTIPAARMGVTLRNHPVYSSSVAHVSPTGVPPVMRNSGATANEPAS